MENEILEILARAVTKEYAERLMEDNAFVAFIIDDIHECADEEYTDDDIRLAIGRAFMWRCGIYF